MIAFWKVNFIFSLIGNERSRWAFWPSWVSINQKVLCLLNRGIKMKTRHDPLSIDMFDKLCSQETKQSDYPLAAEVNSKVVCYDGDALRDTVANQVEREDFQEELARVLESGPGVFVVRDFFNTTQPITQLNAVIKRLFEQQAGTVAADHFAKAGENGRIWNVLEKTALEDAASHIEYYKNPLFQLVSEAWLGPNYQLTAQINVVRPGGQAQAPHRDYHLGFQDEGLLKHYPPHVHKMSAKLTLQGAVAHTDMPLESGPTLLLPYSQQYDEGYLAWRHDDFKAYFDKYAVQLALKQGDAMFFNPALFHAAGSNHTKDFHRMANLFQVSSAFGRAMESVDREAMYLAIYPELLRCKDELSEPELEALLANTCEGYSFPTNLDTDPPVGGMSPQTQKELVRDSLNTNLSANLSNNGL